MKFKYKLRTMILFKVVKQKQTFLLLQLKYNKILEIKIKKEKITIKISSQNSLD